MANKHAHTIGVIHAVCAEGFVYTLVLFNVQYTFNWGFKQIAKDVCMYVYRCSPQGQLIRLIMFHI